MSELLMFMFKKKDGAVRLKPRPQRQIRGHWRRRASRLRPQRQVHEYWQRRAFRGKPHPRHQVDEYRRQHAFEGKPESERTAKWIYDTRVKRRIFNEIAMTGSRISYGRFSGNL